MTPTLAVQNLAKNYGTTAALAGITFQIAPGEIFGLLGPNGAGKTTAIECIVGLRRPDVGTVRIADLDALAQPTQVKNLIGVQLQSTALQDKITPRQALRLFGSFYENSAPPDELLENFGLNEKANASFDSLSGGQRQRLALAIALVHRPRLIFLDEPSVGLDPPARRDLHAAIASIKQSGAAILLTTHYMEEAQRLCDRVAILHKGKIAAIGPPADLIAAAKSPSSILVATARPLAQSQAAALPAVLRAAPRASAWQLYTSALTPTLLALVHLTDSEKNEILDLQIHRPTLEDVFLELTGESLAE